MYEKNLSESMHLRLSSSDMDFLRDLSSSRSCSVSDCIRSIIGDYRRSLETIDILKNTLALANSIKGGELSHGDTETNIDNKL